MNYYLDNKFRKEYVVYQSAIYSRLHRDVDAAGWWPFGTGGYMSSIQSELGAPKPTYQDNIHYTWGSIKLLLALVPPILATNLAPILELHVEVAMLHPPPIYPASPRIIITWRKINWWLLVPLRPTYGLLEPMTYLEESRIGLCVFKAPYDYVSYLNMLGRRSNRISAID